jgi:hypothetical protein
VLKIDIIDFSKLETQCCGNNKPKNKNKKHGKKKIVCYTTM